MTTPAWQHILLTADSEVYLVNNTYVTVDQDRPYSSADPGEYERKRKKKELEDTAATNARRRKMIDRISRGLPAEEPEPEEVEDKFVITPSPNFVPKEKAKPVITDKAFVFPPLNITSEEMETVLRAAAEYRHQVLLSRRRALLASLKGKK